MKLKKISDEKLKQLALDSQRQRETAPKELPVQPVRQTRVTFPLQFSLSGNRFTALDEW